MDDWVTRAEVTGVHGILGELRVRVRTDYPERLRAAQTWTLRQRNGDVREWQVNGIRDHRGGWLVRLEGLTDRSSAEPLLHAEVVAAPHELPPLPAGEYYWHQLIGLRVVTVDGAPVGTIQEILRTGSNDVYVTEGPLIPAIADVIERVDLELKEVVIRPLPGLLEP